MKAKRLAPMALCAIELYGKADWGRLKAQLRRVAINLAVATVGLASLFAFVRWGPDAPSDRVEAFIGFLLLAFGLLFAMALLAAVGAVISYCGYMHIERCRKDVELVEAAQAFDRVKRIQRRHKKTLDKIELALTQAQNPAAAVDEAMRILKSRPGSAV